MVRTDDGKGPNNITKQIADIHAQIEVMEKKWEELGASPSSIKLDGFLINIRGLALLDIIREELNIPEEVMELHFKKRLLKELEDAYEQFAPAIKNARMEAIRVDTAMMPKLVGLDGKEIKH